MPIKRQNFDRIDAEVPEGVAAAMVQEAFGIGGIATRLTGERDLNFRIDGVGGERHLLKISNSSEDAAVSDLQTQALLHLERVDPFVPVPRIVRTLDGSAQYLWRRAGEPPVIVRLLTFLTGSPLAAQQTAALPLEQVGQALARFDIALSGFDHSADDHDLLWDLQHIDHAPEMLDAVHDRSRRELALRSLRLVESRTLPRLAGLRRQVIHNDLNPSNVLIDDVGRVSGILDLGDAIRAPLVSEVAIAATYHIGTGDDPLRNVEAMLKGYVAVLPLTEEEIGMIIPLIIARLSKIVTISAWRAERHPENRSYILRNAEMSWRSLDLLMKLGLDAGSDLLLRSLGRAIA